uniref:hAT-like transposase RNase-H fold domain-containing protein n=1 Tax=Solanum lycopersicum TaxID=4081 RepID=A0A3Q7G771_SOLLC
MIEGNNGDVVVAPLKFDQEECRKALCRMVIIDELPIRFVEKEGFNQFMKVAKPCFQIPSRTTVTHDYFDLFDEEKHKLMAVFKETRQRVSLTTDTWTSIQRINYMIITAHWIDKIGLCIKELSSFVQSLVIECTITELSKQLTKWGTNLMGGSHLLIRRMAHIVNLIAQDGTKEANVSIERVRQALRYIRQSPARWNFTYMILSRVIEYEGAIVEYVDRDIGLALYLKFVDKNSAGTLLSNDWEGVKRIIIFLEMFFDLTLKISGSQYVTSDLHFLEICQVGVYLNQFISNEDQVFAKIAKNMKEKFDKYCGDAEKMNKMVFIPGVLDPRHKYSTLHLALKKMFGKKGAAIENGV